MRLRVGRQTAVVGMAAAMVLSVGSATWADTAPGADSASVDPGGSVQTVGLQDGGYLTTYTAPNGDVTKVFTMSPVTVTPVAPTSTQITVDGQTLTEHAGGIDVQPVDTYSRPPAGYQSEITPYEELLAMGANPADIAMFNSSNSDVTNIDKTLQVAEQGHQIGQPACVSAQFDGGHGNVYGCDVTREVASNSDATWFLTDALTSSGVMHDPNCSLTCDHITGLKFGNDYGSGNIIQAWNPADNYPVGSCVTNTVTLGYHGSSVSSTANQCPETFGLYDINSTHYSTKWDGQGSGPTNGSRATHAVDGVYNPPAANPYPGADAAWWYTTCC